MATKKAITMTNGSMVIKFDIIIPTEHGALFCACLQRTQEVASGGIGKGTQISIANVHELLGHCNENATHKTAKQLEWKITRGALKLCKKYAIAKAHQKNVQKESRGERGTEPNK